MVIELLERRGSPQGSRPQLQPRTDLYLQRTSKVWPDAQGEKSSGQRGTRIWKKGRDRESGRGEVVLMKTRRERQRKRHRGRDTGHRRGRKAARFQAQPRSLCQGLGWGTVSQGCGRKGNGFPLPPGTNHLHPWLALCLWAAPSRGQMRL